MGDIMKKNNIVLCGFMGCGKTTVGKKISTLTGMPYVDMDAYIEEQEGKAISDIFKQNGELYFRKLETNACHTLSEKSGIIICLGGGALLNRENADALAKTGMIFLLDVTPEVVINRLKDDTTRPLLQSPHKAQVVKKLMEQRLPVYKENSNITVNGNQSPQHVAIKVITLFENSN